MTGNYELIQHWLGTEAAHRLANANPDAAAERFAPSSVVSGNPRLFCRPDGAQRTVVELLEVLQARTCDCKLH
jgi:hypothetical protein